MHWLLWESVLNAFIILNICLFDFNNFLLKLMCSPLCVRHSGCFGSVRTAPRSLLPTLESTINLDKLIKKNHQIHKKKCYIKECDQGLSI